MLKNSISILMIGLLCFSQLKAQDVKDLALWTNIYLDKKVNKHFNIHLNQQTRFSENISHFNLAYADIGVTYKIHKNIKVAVDYVYIRRYQNDDRYINNRHQFYAFLSARKKWNNSSLTYRLMAQSQVDDVLSSDNGALQEWNLRNKFTYKYDFNLYWTGYVAQEIYFPLNTIQTSKHDPDGLYINRSRSFAGVFYNLSSSSSIELYYMVQKRFNVNAPLLTFVTGIGYSVQF